MQLVQPHKEVVPASAAAVASFLEKINMAETKPAILKFTQPYAQEFIPK